MSFEGEIWTGMRKRAQWERKRDEKKKGKIGKN
jgi:hypothetical protein